MKLDGVSLVCKYSYEYPNLLILPDGDGNIYIANCLRSFDIKLPEAPQVAEIEPDSNFEYRLEQSHNSLKESSELSNLQSSISIGMINQRNSLLALLTLYVQFGMSRRCKDSSKDSRMIEALDQSSLVNTTQVNPFRNKCICAYIYTKTRGF